MNAAIPDLTQHLIDGLNSDEAARRLASDGANELAAERPRTVMLIAREILAKPMFLLLAAAGIYLLLGDLRESLVLAASIAVIVVITIPSGAANRARTDLPARRRSGGRGCHRAQCLDGRCALPFLSIRTAQPESAPHLDRPENSGAPLTICGSSPPGPLSIQAHPLFD